MAAPIPPTDLDLNRRDRDRNDPFAPRTAPPVAKPPRPIDPDREDAIMQGISRELSSARDPAPVAPRMTRRGDDLDELPEPKSAADNIDPVISGLLTHLPTPGSVWSMDARKLWLQIIEGAFDMIYKKAPEPEQQRNNNDPHGTALQDQ